MSGLERSILERKERDELTQIAEQLGKKPPARASKAKIVDLILELAGVGAPAPEAESAPKATTKAATNGAKARAAAPAADADEADEPEAEVADEQADAAEEPDGEPTGDEAETAEAAPEAERAPARPRGEQARGGEGRGDGQPRGNGQGQQQGQQQGQGQQGQGQGQQGERGPNYQEDAGHDDEAESGNRRRRRRGRDRNRPDLPDPSLDAEPIDVEGFLDLRDEGYGFLRLNGYLPSKEDIYVSVKQVRQFGLRRGDRVAGKSRAAARNEKNPALLQIDAVNGGSPETARERPRFEDLTPLFPDERLRLETDDPNNMTARIVDLIAPIGKGQRGLIVSPPKAGKTTIMKQICRSIETNSPEVELIVLLVDERPEEVTDFRRWLKRGEVAASTFDRPSEEHVHVAELVIERAKRMVEEGKDVCIVLDGITRLARAYNLAHPATGRIMSGGIDAGALYPPKKFFGAARNVEEGGSLTILATALVETNSRMDEHIFEEFKGTGNMELKLDRRLAERRIFPAIDVDASSTRHEELLFSKAQLAQVWKLRRVLQALKDDGGGSNAAGLELLIDRMRSFRTNDAFLSEIAKSAT